jgi:purine-binding chemotaxis protein CheW
MSPKKASTRGLSPRSVQAQEENRSPSTEPAGPRQPRRTRAQSRQQESRARPAGPGRESTAGVAATEPAAPVRSGGAALVFEVAGQRLGLPVKQVVQIIEMVDISPLPAGPDYVAGVIDFHGRVIPVIDLRRRFRWPAEPYTLRTPIVIGRLDGCVAGLVVDGVRGVVDLSAGQVQLATQIVPSALGPAAQFVSAVGRLDDGLVLILQPSALLSRQEQETLVQSPPARRPRRARASRAAAGRDGADCPGHAGHPAGYYPEPVQHPPV